MARINQLHPEYIVNEKMDYCKECVENNRWKTQRKFIKSSLEVFWNGQKLLPHDSENGIEYDYNIVDDQTVEIVGVDDDNNQDVVKKDYFVCNYLVKC